MADKLEKQPSRGRGMALYLGASPWWLTDGYQLVPCQLETGNRCPILVLGREHYQEVTVTVPMSTRKEIRSAINFDPDAFLPPELAEDAAAGPDGSVPRTWFFRRLVGCEESTEINLWVLNENSRQMVESFEPLWIIPETAVLHQYEQRIKWKIQRPDGSWLLAGCESNGSVRSLVTSGDSEAELFFSRVIGGEFEECRELSRDQWPGFLGRQVFAGRHRPWESWFRLSRHWQDFRYPEGWRRRFGDLRQHRLTLALAGGLLVVLFAGQLLLPWWLHRSMAERIVRLTPKVEQVLKTKDRLKAIEARNARLLEVLERPVLVTSVLNLVMKYFPQQGKLYTLKVDGDQVKLSGEIADGSQFLRRLSADERVRGARFLTPLQKIRKSSRQRFSLGFQVVAVRNKAQKQ